MRRVEPDRDEARGIVRARLGRPAQDRLEAIVVLEAWGGVATTTAFALGSGIVAPPSPDAATGRWALPEPDGRESVVAEGFALLLAIIAIAAWAGPLSRQLGPLVLERALQVALPVTLGLQWAIRSRYLSRRAGVRCLAEDLVVLLTLAVLLASSLLVLPRFAPIAGAFVVVWVGGTVLARRGWGVVYGALVTGEAVALGAGAPARIALAALVATTVLLVSLAVRTAGAPSVEPPAPLGRALIAGAIGALLGGVLVADASLGWGVHGAFPALALVPSVIGSFWGGFHLWQFHAEVPRGLRGVPLTQAGGPIARGPAVRIVTGALMRLIGVSAVLSALVVGAGVWTRGTDRTSLFAAFGCAALVCLFVSLHESLGYVRWALLSATAGLAVELAVQRWAGLHVAGAGLIAGGATGTLLALAPLLTRLRSPGRVLATALWIK